MIKSAKITLEEDLLPEDFDKIPENLVGELFFISTGTNYRFMSKIDKLVNNCGAVSKKQVEIGFYNKDETLWGCPTTTFNCQPSAFFKKGPWGVSFLVKRLWINQQLSSAKALGLQTEGLFFQYRDFLIEKYGTPVKFIATFEPFISLVKNNEA